ncbi:hypothetical protein ACFLQ0_04030 [Nitrospinota bacterium]
MVVNRSSSDSRDELIALLHKQIEEREASRDEIEKSIRILKEAERELRQQSPSSPPPNEEERDHLPYRIQPPQAREGAFALDESRPPVHAETFDPQSELEEISFLKKEDTPSPPGETVMEIGDPPELLRDPDPSPRGTIGQEVPEESYRLADVPAKPKRPLANQVDDILQEDQMSLLGREEGQTRKSRPSPETAPPAGGEKPAAPFLRATEPDVGMEIPPPAAARPHTNGAPKRAESLSGKPLPAALETLMNYIRGGGAVRCQDPWGQNCAAFLLSSQGSTILATDVFLNYLRKSIQTLRRLHEEHLVETSSSPSSPAKLDELESLKRFLVSLAGGLLKQSISGLREVAGLKIAGQSPTSDNFDFENSTKPYLHSGFLKALRVLLEKPNDSFFLSGGPYFEIADFLGQYKNFTRETGEEALAASMLTQLGMMPHPEAAEKIPPAGPPRPSELSAPPEPQVSEAKDLPQEDEDEVLELTDPIELPDPEVDTRSFTDEADDLQDLTTFDFDPSDKKSILEQEEDILSMSGFKKALNEGPKEPAGEASPPEAPSDEEPATDSAEKPFSIGNISPAGDSAESSGLAGSSEEEYTLSPETEESESFNLDEFEKLLDEENRPD